MAMTKNEAINWLQIQWHPIYTPGGYTYDSGMISFPIIPSSIINTLGDLTLHMGILYLDEADTTIVTKPSSYPSTYLNNLFKYVDTDGQLKDYEGINGSPYSNQTKWKYPTKGGTFKLSSETNTHTIDSIREEKLSDLSGDTEYMFGPTYEKIYNNGTAPAWSTSYSYLAESRSYRQTSHNPFRWSCVMMFVVDSVYYFIHTNISTNPYLDVWSYDTAGFGEKVEGFRSVILTNNNDFTITYNYDIDDGKKFHNIGSITLNAGERDAIGTYNTSVDVYLTTGPIQSAGSGDIFYVNKGVKHYYLPFL